MAKKVGKRNRVIPHIKQAKVILTLPSKFKDGYVFKERIVPLDKVQEALSIADNQ